MSSLDVAQNMTELEKEFREVKKKIDQFNDSRNDDVEVNRKAFNEQFGSTESLAKLLHTDLENGLSTKDPLDLETRRKVFGENVLVRKKPPSFCQIVRDNLKDYSIIILLAISTIVFIVQIITLIVTQTGNVRKHLEAEDIIELCEPILILILVFVVVFASSFTDWKSVNEQHEIRQSSVKKVVVDVVRDGNVVQIESSKLVVGDLVVLKYGDISPADGVVFYSANLKFDESAMTGESEQIEKSPDGDNLIHGLTNAVEGFGKMFVLGVGINSTNGQIFLQIGLLDEDYYENILKKDQQKGSSKDSKKQKKQQEAKEKASKNMNLSVLEQKNITLTKQLSYTAFAFAILVFIVYAANKDWKDTYRNDGGTIAVVKAILSGIQLSMTVLVVAVPEGIIIATTMTASIASKRMSKDNARVQKNSSCETMGNTTCICSDKTGTLTLNKMQVVQIFVGTNPATVQEFLTDDNVTQNFREFLMKITVINTSFTSHVVTMSEEELLALEGEKHTGPNFTKKILGNVLPEGYVEPEQSGTIQKGNKTDCALLGLCIDAKMDYRKIREDEQVNTVKLYAFNSVRKSMATMIRLENGQLRLCVKGASENILKYSSQMKSGDESIKPLTEELRNDISEKVIQVFAEQALRTIGIAYKDYAEGETPDLEDEDAIFENLTLVGIVGIEDPVRPEVPGCIRLCGEANVKVIMMTGDHIATATSIAKNSGIINSRQDLALTSDEFKERVYDSDGNFNQQRFDQIFEKLAVLARLQPEIKSVVVHGVQQTKALGRREIVAVTGDGTNDAPALQKSDVGFAMGLTGTDIAKAAADIILMDDQFQTVLKCLVWGRNMYDAITKFLQFQLTTNFVVLLLILSTSHVTHVPLKPIPLLFLNMIMDTCGSFALATDFPHKEQLNRKPRDRNASLISSKMLRKICSHVLFQTVLLVTLFYTWNYYACWIFGEFRGELVKGIQFYVTTQKNGFRCYESIAPGLDLNSARKEYKDHVTRKSDLFRNLFIYISLLQLTFFNEINARMVMGERNSFARITDNKFFMIIWLCSYVFAYILALFVGEYIGLKSLIKMDFETNHAGKVLLFIAITTLIGTLSLAWEQVILTIIPLSCFKRCIRRIRKLFTCCAKDADDTEAPGVVQTDSQPGDKGAEDAGDAESKLLLADKSTTPLPTSDNKVLNMFNEVVRGSNALNASRSMRYTGLVEQEIILGSPTRQAENLRASVRR